jgi:hypothetical protein
MTSDRDAIALAERVIGILDEGSFSATYKFALFTAILDLCIENTNRHGVAPSTLTTRQLANKVVELYWAQTIPYRGHGTLRQGGVRPSNQAEIVRRIEDERMRWSDGRNGTLYRVRQAHREDFERLVDFVEWKLIEMPIPRLQVLGGQEDRFLYHYNWTQGIRQSTVTVYQRRQRSDFDNQLYLVAGVAENLVRLNGVLRPLFHREWATMVAGMNSLPEAELEKFLFGAERTSLDAVRGPLGDIQDHRCFYCAGGVDGRAEVDHFIPWSRYPDDGLDNLVAAHPRCNNSKRDFLASAEHVEHWKDRGKAHATEFGALATDASWPRDTERTKAVARAIYARLPGRARLWIAPSSFGLNERDRILGALGDW